MPLIKKMESAKLQLMLPAHKVTRTISARNALKVTT
jgi:hypothetical protein